MHLLNVLWTIGLRNDKVLHAIVLSTIYAHGHVISDFDEAEYYDEDVGQCQRVAAVHAFLVEIDPRIVACED